MNIKGKKAAKSYKPPKLPREQVFVSFKSSRDRAVLCVCIVLQNTPNDAGNNR